MVIHRHKNENSSYMLELKFYIPHILVTQIIEITKARAYAR